jgi:hypothetical protein
MSFTKQLSLASACTGLASEAIAMEKILHRPFVCLA